MVALGEQRFLNAFQDLQGSVHEAVETCQQQDEGESVTATTSGEEAEREKERMEVEDKDVTSDNSPGRSSSTSTSSSSPRFGRGLRGGLTEQLSRTPSSLSRVPNVPGISASLVTDSTGLAGSQKPDKPVESVEEQLLKDGELSELLGGAGIVLIDGTGVVEEKEVGPEVLGGEEPLSKLSLIEGSSQLDKELDTSQIESEPLSPLPLFSLSLSLSLPLFPPSLPL